jgi:putative transposase
VERFLVSFSDMPRRLRFIPPEGAVVEVTTRTIQGRLLLRPSRLLNLIVLGTLGRSQRLYRVRLHDFVFMSNHYHLLLSVDSALQLARFMGYFNGNLAKEVARLTQWKDKIWSRRYQAVLISTEPEAQLARQRYIFSHGLKENLVDSPRTWPGVTSLEAHLSGRPLEGLWFDRTQQFKARRQRETSPAERFSEKETVCLTPLPCLANLSDDEHKALVEKTIADIELEGARDIRASGRPPVGEHQIRTQPHNATPQRSKRSPAPFAHCASTKQRRQLWKAYCWFLAAYLDAKESLRAGRQARFPEGSFPPPAPFVDIELDPG